LPENVKKNILADYRCQ